MVSNIKMEVNSDLSIRVQEIVLKNGGKWREGNSIWDTGNSFLYISGDYTLAMSGISTKKAFKKHEYKEISAYDFIASQGEEEWLPKYGEVCEFFGDDCTVTAKFKFYEPGALVPFATTKGWFRYCKPLAETKTITIDGKNIEISRESFEELKQQLCKG